MVLHYCCTCQLFIYQKYYYPLKESENKDTMKNRFLHFLKSSYIFIIVAATYIPLIIVIILSFTAPSDKGNLNLGFNFNNGEN